MLQIATLNVNGIRAAIRKGMGNWLESRPNLDVLALQETRAPADMVQHLVGDAWDTVVCESRIKGRAGVALMVKKTSPWKITSVTTSLGDVYDSGTEPDVDSGRWIETTVRYDPQADTGRVTSPEITEITLVSAYLHSGEVGSEKLTQKLAHLQRVTKRLSALSKNRHVLVMGDFNVVRGAQDIKNFRPNHNKTSGVLDEEIAFLETWMGKDGTWCDVLRSLHPHASGPYTWWSWRGQAFTNDAGWRIDYHMATAKLAAKASAGEVDKPGEYAERFTDHAPVVVGYNL